MENKKSDVRKTIGKGILGFLIISAISLLLALMYEPKWEIYAMITEGLAFIFFLVSMLREERLKYYHKALICFMIICIFLFLEWGYNTTAVYIEKENENSINIGKFNSQFDDYTNEKNSFEIDNLIELLKSNAYINQENTYEVPTVRIVNLDGYLIEEISYNVVEESRDNLNEYIELLEDSRTKLNSNKNYFVTLEKDINGYVSNVTIYYSNNKITEDMITSNNK